MIQTRRWIVGNGLLGRAVRRARPDDDVFLASIRWGDATDSAADLAAALARFTAEPDIPLGLYWCAGRGVTSASAEQMQAEVRVFDDFLQQVMRLPDEVRARLSFFLASSVGGAYAGSTNPPFTEFTVPVPLSEYGKAKLRMEEMLSASSEAGGWRTLIARITNLYGPGQDLSKGQGLISALVSSFVTGRPASIFVSLDTLRDYIYEDDCARVIDAAMARTAEADRGTVALKIVGAMAAQSIGAIIGENARLRRRRAPIILGQGDSRGQAHDLRVRSEVWTDLDGLVRTTLPEGLGNIFAAQLASRSQPADSR